MKHWPPMLERSEVLVVTGDMFLLEFDPLGLALLAVGRQWQHRNPAPAPGQMRPVGEHPPMPPERVSLVQLAERWKADLGDLEAACWRLQWAVPSFPAAEVFTS